VSPQAKPGVYHFFIIFIHSNLGNGKSIIVEIIKYKLSKHDIHIFILTNNNLTKIKEEIYNISRIKGKKVIIIEDFFDFKTALNTFASIGKDITYVFTARSPIFIDRYMSTCELFQIKDNESHIVDANILTDNEISSCSKILKVNGLLGDLAGKTTEQIISHLKSKKHGKRSFQFITIDLIKSNHIKDSINAIIKNIKERSQSFYQATILILMMSILKMGIKLGEALYIIGVSQGDPNFRSNHAIREIIEIESEKNRFKINSPIVARYILGQLDVLYDIINIMIKIAKYCANYSGDERYSAVLRNIISISFINDFLKNFDSKKRSLFILNYYDELRMIDVYNQNHFFWLQYAMACIDIGDLEKAQRYINNSYEIASVHSSFVPFQINNQQARLFLESIVRGSYTNLTETFEKANAILMLPISSQSDNEENVIKLFIYYTQRNFINKFKTNNELFIFNKYCKSAYNRVSIFNRKKIVLSGRDYSGLEKDLFKYSFLKKDELDVIAKNCERLPLQDSNSVS
jgi:hypothetical protein